MAATVSVSTSLSPFSLTKSHLSLSPPSSSLSFLHRPRINGCSVSTNLSHGRRRRRENVRAAVDEAATDQTPLTMLFQAEGTMKKTAIPTVTYTLKGMEGVGNLKVQLVEGIASIELTKETTLLATGTASDLVEIIQGSGFKLQTLKLSFEDKEDIYWNLG